MPDVQHVENIEEATARGLNSGWDAANYHYAYVSENAPESVGVLAESAGSDKYTIGWSEWRAFVDGYILGFGRFVAGQWQDGTPQE